jgi:hypothetical protein
MKETKLKTECKLNKEARDLAIYNEWKELMRQPDAMASAVDAFLMKKHSIFSKSTIWNIRKRAKKYLMKIEAKK